MSLQVVSFSRRQDPQPRLSKRYVPGRHSERFWSPEEDLIIRDHYETEGSAYCLERLPGRTPSSVYQRAKKLGLGTPRKTSRSKRRPDLDALDAGLREVWPTLTGRGALQSYAESIGVERWVLTRRAVTLGLTKAHRVKEPPWTAAEDALLHQVPLHDPPRASKIFRDHGFNRSPTALVVRSTRLKISRRRRDTLSATEAAEILGVDAKWVTKRCFDGALEATKAGTARLVQQGGDRWAIKQSAFRDFVLTHLEEIDIRKVDKFLFVDLLVGSRPTTAE